MVKFNDDATRDHVLENDIIHFDRKPVIIRPWTTDLSVVRLVLSVPLWIRLQDLGLQYWGSKCLSALVSTIGKPIMVDKYTRERSHIQFARVLVDMEVTDNPPKSIQYINEHGQIMEQGVEYEWLPIKCKNCTGFGHSMTDCRKKKNAQWVMKESKSNKEEKEHGLYGNKDVELELAETQAGTEEVTVQASSEEDKEGHRSVTIAKNLGQKNKRLNKFVVLQEDLDFGVTFVYGVNSIEGRRSLWEGLRRPFLKDKAWLFLGDFNAPFLGKDRSGGKPILDLELADPIRWLVEAYVEHLKSVGSYFTWTNNQNGDARIYTKIDHVLINEKWIDLFPQSTAMFRWEAISDHFSCLVKTQVPEKMGTRVFRFYNYWTKNHDFHAQVLRSWKLPINDAGIKAIYLKLLRLKHCLKAFNIDKIGDLKVNYYKAKETYQEAQMQAQAYPHALSYQEVERKAAEALSVQERLYQSFLVQRIKKHKAENGIVSFITDDGKMVDKFSEVVSHFVGHFRDFLGRHRDEVCAAITQCFETGNFPTELHGTTLSLIPKVANPSRAVDYRPVACCSTLWKCMAKLICKRIADILPDLVQPNQGAFVKGRSISHNIMIFQDLIKNYGRTSTSSRCAIKIDLRKAYDTVDWDFLEDLLKALRFPMKFISWVMACVRNTSYFLLMNGRIQGKFKGGKGLRQGDPMSPLLFVLIMEYLTRSLQLAALSSPFRYHPMCKSLKLINLCFADDLLLFCKGYLPVVRAVKEVLDDFASATGLSINSDKSHVFFGGVSNIDRTRIALELNLSEGSFPLNYLGVPMRPTKWKHEDCEVIIQKFRLKIQNWASRHLSFAGRIQPINLVLLGLRNYWMSIFVLPQSIVKEIEKICQGFLWGSSGQRSKLHIPSWQKVCLPKAYGGLGFREGAIWNRAVLAKYVWVVSAKPDLLWVKWIHSIYLKGVNFWNYDLIVDCSWYWRKLCHLRVHFRPTDILSAGAQGKFKSARLYNNLLVQQRVEYYRTVWSRIILPNHRFMLWQVVNSQLLTRDNLSRLHVQMASEMCPVCDRFQESHSHLFFDCSLSNQLVNSIFDWLGFVAWPLDFQSWLVWLARARNGVKADIVNMVCAAVTYIIWRNRNKCFHDGYSSTLAGFLLVFESLTLNCFDSHLYCSFVQ
ncbi:uncharacterized protein LOC133785111 [Humulus lupulus]|uniref:uncharacterized protein LOC133785111 n=1 Tax=Humulus lupulus TaxID=3486 RepID=UPI002B4079A9|nr:uncharacterized protein LOC133785111 [Humulus lupulus]